MWLLNAFTQHLEHFEGEQTPPYAILSHRWEDGEVTFDDIRNKSGEDKKGWRKIDLCCQQAIKEAAQATKSETLTGKRMNFEQEIRYNTRQVYVWVDTCCIDKSNSSELSEAINSMYEWYENARVCYAYLGDVFDKFNDGFGLRKSAWFTRCWTLQELLAPQEVQFYDHDWTMLGTKTDIGETLSSITGIPKSAFIYFDPHAYSIAERMSWAANRFSTRKEDAAYSLLGLFGVNMPMIYGEGMRAFQRLQEEILRRSEDLTLFAWSKLSPSSLSYGSGLLARSPRAFEKRGIQLEPFNIRTTTRLSRSMQQPLNEWQGISLTSAGLAVDLYLMPFYTNVYLAPIGCIVSKTVDGKSPDDSASGPGTLASGHNPSDVVCMVISRQDQDGYFQRQSVNEQCTFYVPLDWLGRGRVRRVMLAHDSLQLLEGNITSANATYGFNVKNITLKWGNENDTRIMSRVEPGGPIRRLLLPMGTFGLAGAIHMDSNSRVTPIVMLGFDFDFNIFCLVMTECNIPRRTDLRDASITLPTIMGRTTISIANSEAVMWLVEKVRVATEKELMSDQISPHFMTCKESRVDFTVGHFGEISLKRRRNTPTLIDVEIDTRVPTSAFLDINESEPEGKWYVHKWPAREGGRFNNDKR